MVNFLKHVWSVGRGLPQTDEEEPVGRFCFPECDSCVCNLRHERLTLPSSRVFAVIWQPMECGIEYWTGDAFVQQQSASCYSKENDAVNVFLHADSHIDKILLMREGHSVVEEVGVSLLCKCTHCKKIK